MKKLLSDTKLKQELTILANKLNSKCEEDCSGLCIDCGINLNMKKCGCGNNTRNTKI